MGNPHGAWAPTLMLWDASDAIMCFETTYVTAVRYYLANLGRLCSPQLDLSVAPPTTFLLA